MSYETNTCPRPDRVMWSHLVQLTRHQQVLNLLAAPTFTKPGQVYTQHMAAMDACEALAEAWELATPVHNQLRDYFHATCIEA
jgi:hypothetical protein